jgi:hypothetical protein
MWDILFIVLTLVLFKATLLLVWLFDALQERRQ